MPKSVILFNWLEDSAERWIGSDQTPCLSRRHTAIPVFVPFDFAVSLFDVLLRGQAGFNLTTKRLEEMFVVFFRAESFNEFPAAVHWCHPRITHDRGRLGRRNWGPPP